MNEELDDIDRQVDELFKTEEEGDLTPLEIKKRNEDDVFIKEMVDDPVKDETYNQDILGRSMTFYPFLKMLMFPEGIYEGDKYLQMIAGWRYDWIKRLMRRKRHMPFNWTWLIIIVVLAIIGLFVMIIIMNVYAGIK